MPQPLAFLNAEEMHLAKWPRSPLSTALAQSSLLGDEPHRFFPPPWEILPYSWKPRKQLLLKGQNRFSIFHFPFFIFHSHLPRPAATFRSSIAISLTNRRSTSHNGKRIR